MTTPSVVVFDLGKVLVDFDYSIAARKISARSAQPAVDIRKLLDHSPLLYRYETGLMTRQDFFEEVRRATGFNGTIEEFSGFFADIFWEIPPMIEIQATLRRQGIPTYIFSNTNDLAIGHIRRNFPFFEQFDAHVLSYEHRAMKPDAKLYEIVEHVTGRQGAKILYLDDRIENVAAGRARGWQVIHHRDAASSIRAVEATGLPVRA